MLDVLSAVGEECIEGATGVQLPGSALGVVKGGLDTDRLKGSIPGLAVEHLPLLRSVVLHPCLFFGSFHGEGPCMN